MALRGKHLSHGSLERLYSRKLDREREARFLVAIAGIPTTRASEHSIRVGNAAYPAKWTSFGSVLLRDDEKLHAAQVACMCEVGSEFVVRKGDQRPRGFIVQLANRIV